MVTASYSGTSVTISRWAQSHAPQHFNPHQHRLGELKYRMHASGTEGKYAYKPIANWHCLRFALAAVPKHITEGNFMPRPSSSVLTSVSDWITWYDVTIWRCRVCEGSVCVEGYDMKIIPHSKHVSRNCKLSL